MADYYNHPLFLNLCVSACVDTYITCMHASVCMLMCVLVFVFLLHMFVRLQMYACVCEILST